MTQNNTNKHFINIVKYRALWMWITVVLILPGVVAMVYSMINSPNHLPIKVGIDYTGGTVLQYTIHEEVSNNELAELRTKLETNGIENPQLQIINVNPTAENNNAKAIVSVRTKFINEKSDSAIVDSVTSTVKSEYSDAVLVSTNSIGPTLGNELFKNSLIALTLACLGIVAYLTIRFKIDFAIAAILGVIHDVLFVIGMFSIFGIIFNTEIDGLFITAILTVIGFSVHDTIVVFDRVRENLRYYSKKMSFGEIINFSINQTIVRSINTSLTTLITLAALYFFGGVTTKSFVLAMILGIAIGTYSSIFFASVLLDFWNERKRTA